MTPLFIKSNIYIAAISLIAAMLVFGCSENKGGPDQAEIERIAALPVQTIVNLQTIVSDSGKIKTTLVSPLYEEYSQPDLRYSLFPKGLNFTNYLANNDVDGAIVCKYARNFIDKNLWELRDSVIATNSKKEIFETELLYWDEKSRKVYTDKYIKVTRPDEILTGYGLDANQEFTKWSIRKVTGTFKMKVNN